MIRTAVRSAAATAVLAAAALVSVPGTALADTVVGPTFIIGNITGNTVVGSDDGLAGELPGIGAPAPAPAPAARAYIATGPALPYSGLVLVSREGGEYPEYLPPNTTGVITPFEPISTGVYRLANGNGEVKLVLEKDKRPTCSTEGALSCQYEPDRYTGRETFVIDGSY